MGTGSRGLDLVVRLVGDTKKLDDSFSKTGRTLTKIDREQKAFFKKAFCKTDAPASEFDLVVNFDHLGEPRLAADLVARCFRKKFRIEPE